MRPEPPAAGRDAQPGQTTGFLLRYVRRRLGLALGVVGAVAGGLATQGLSSVAPPACR